jgi:uncharacterized protein YdhG (YjbR/CyaY superfamily)
MLYDAKTPQAYIDSLEVDWRKGKLQELRDIILEQDKCIIEIINYRMLCFKLNNSVLFHLNVQKGYVSLYCENTKVIDPEGEFLVGLNIGKGCIRFTKTKKISDTGIKYFIRKAVELLKEGKDIG